MWSSFLSFMLLVWVENCLGLPADLLCFAQRVFYNTNFACLSYLLFSNSVVWFHIKLVKGNQGPNFQVFSGTSIRLISRQLFGFTYFLWSSIHHIILSCWVVNFISNLLLGVAFASGAKLFEKIICYPTSIMYSVLICNVILWF